MDVSQICFQNKFEHYDSKANLNITNLIIWDQTQNIEWITMNRRLIATLLVMLFLGSVGTNDILEDSVNTLMNNSRYVDILNDWNQSTVLVDETGISADDPDNQTSNSTTTLTGYISIFTGETVYIVPTEPGNAAIVSLRKPSKTSGPFGPSRVSVMVAVGRGGLRTKPDKSTPSGTSLIDRPQGLGV